MNSDELISLVLGGIMMMIPIVAILTHHQRKMAEIYRESHSVQEPAVLEEVLRLRDEVERLRSELQATMIALDDLRPNGRPEAAPSRIDQRFGEV